MMVLCHLCTKLWTKIPAVYCMFNIRCFHFGELMVRALVHLTFASITETYQVVCPQLFITHLPVLGEISLCLLGLDRTSQSAKISFSFVGSWPLRSSSSTCSSNASLCWLLAESPSNWLSCSFTETARLSNTPCSASSVHFAVAISTPREASSWNRTASTRQAKMYLKRTCRSDVFRIKRSKFRTITTFVSPFQTQVGSVNDLLSFLQ